MKKLLLFIFRAAEWALDSPDWTGRLKLVSIGEKLELRLEDKNTGLRILKCIIGNFIFIFEAFKLKCPS